VNLYLDGDGIDEHLGMVSPQGTLAFETDHLGSVLNTEVAGPLQTYGAFGESLGGLASLSRSSNPVQYGFAGRQLDSESGNYYNRARIYSPTLGRFTTKDPIGLNGGDTNLYGYVVNDPINHIDPTGHSGIGTIIGGLGGIVVGGVGPAALGGLLTDLGFVGIGSAISGIAVPGGIIGGAVGAGLGAVSTANSGVPGLPGSPNSSPANPGIPGILGGSGSGGSGGAISCR
jgi:RHS repeat-associated protein